jgi:phage terminase large subunit-like protein
MQMTSGNFGSPAWSTAVPDWKARIRARQSLVPTLPLDRVRAERALRIFKNLRVPDIEGTPTHGEVCDQWVFDLVLAIFGAFDAETSRRMIREYFVLIPKKNGKTSIAAAIIVVALLLNERPSAEALLIAPTQKIAGASYKQACGIIRLSETPSGTPLSVLFSVHDHEKTIKYLSEDVPSSMTIKAADTDVVTGSKASIVLIDETHVFASHRKAADVFIEIRGGLSHPQNKGFLLQITTQSKEPPHGVFKAELARARGVRDGTIQTSLLAILYELPFEDVQKDGWKRRELWGLVNPHMGRSVDEGYLLERLIEAEGAGKPGLALFASQHLNVEIGQQQFGDAWAGVKNWQACALPGLTLDRLLAESEVVTIGVDWGGADDLASLAVIGRQRLTRKWLLWTRSWARPTVLEERPQIVTQLEGFEKAGDLVVVNTAEEQAEQAADICAQVAASGLLPAEQAIGLDSAGVALLVDALLGSGLIAKRGR